jgi:Na+/proline symporter
VTAATPLNSGLYRVHRVFYIAIAAFAIIMLIIGLPTLIRGGEDAGIGFLGLGVLPLGVAHWYAAKGAKNGQTYGKVLSRIIGSLWLIGFPIGTALGIYVWSQTGTKWKGPVEAGSKSA